MKRKFKILDYSLLATSMLAGRSPLEGDVIYTNIDDIILDDNYENYLIDLNDDGIGDFEFTKFSGTYLFFTSSGFTELRNFDWITITPKNNDGEDYNEIAGKSSSTYFSYLVYWPYALSNGMLIDDNLNFNQIAGVELLASRIDLYPGGAVISGNGYWYPEIEDQFVGVRFLDLDSNFHYGWIRCSVMDSGEVLVIKDFAYETQIEHPIIAGDTISYVSIEPVNLIGTNIYSFGKTLYIISEQLMVHAELSIFDLNGNSVYQEELNCKTAVLKLNLLEGLYIIELKNDMGRSIKMVNL